MSMPCAWRGANIHAPCVNRSEHLTRIENDDVYLGFIHIKGLPERLSLKILQARRKGGEFQDFEDFMSRVPIGRKPLNLLIRIDAFRFTGIPYVELLWQKNEYLGDGKAGEAMRLLPMAKMGPSLSQLEHTPIERIFEQIEILGFPLVSPFQLIEAEPEGDITTDEFSQHLGRRIRILGYFVTRKRITTKQGKMHVLWNLDRSARKIF